MTEKHLAIIKENHELFMECLERGHIDTLAEVFRLKAKSGKRKRCDLVEIDKTRIQPLATGEAERFLLDFARLPKVSNDKVEIYTDGACDINFEGSINWAGQRAGVGVYFDLQNFKNHISCYVEQKPTSSGPGATRVEAKEVIERAEAQALLAALVLIRTYNYRWIVIAIDCKNVLNSICRYIRNGLVADYETFDMLFHVLFTALPSGVNVVLKKVKSHIGIVGNENADHLAKNGKRKQYTMLEMIEFIESFVPKKSGKKKGGANGAANGEWTVKSTGRKGHKSVREGLLTENSSKLLLSTKRYRFWIVYVPHCIENWQIEHVVGLHSKVSSRPKNSDFHKRDLLVESTKATYCSLVALGHVTFGSSGPVSIRCDVVPYVEHCDRCLQVGHFGTYCTQTNVTLCGICGAQGHLHFQCPTPKRNVCYNCMLRQQPSDHSTFSNFCPQRMPYIDRAREWARQMIGTTNRTSATGSAVYKYKFIDFILTI